MNFGIADTFTDSLPRLTGEEQKAVKISDPAADRIATAADASGLEEV